MTPSKAINRLAEFGPAVLRRHVSGPACVLSTRVGLDVLEQFGVPAAPLSVAVFLANAATVAWWACGRPGGETGLLKAGGYMLDTEGGFVKNPPPGKPWNGHLAIELIEHGALLDLDIRQMARPAHGIEVPAVGFFSWDGNAITAPLSRGAQIVYRAKREDRSYEAARDWTDRAKRAAIVLDLERAIRKGRL